MKSYSVVLGLSLVACSANTPDLFPDIEAPLGEDDMRDSSSEVGGSDSEPSQTSDPDDGSSQSGDDGSSMASGDDPESMLGDLPLDDVDLGEVASGSGDDSPDPGAGPDEGDDEPVSTEPPDPRILSVSPADGQAGVFRDQPIVITFSTSMDRESTEAAYQSETIPSTSVTFEWSEDDTVLTVRPNEPLEYDSGEIPEEVEARRFTFFISSSARDSEGNALDQTAEFEFSLFREITGVFPALASRDLTGHFRSNDTYGDGQCARDQQNLCVGDSGEAEDEQYKGFISFDVTALPPSMARLDRAQLTLEVTDTQGNPFGNLGDLVVEHAAFESIGAEAFSAEPIGVVGVIARNLTNGNVLSLDVRDAVEADVGKRQMTQFRLFFESSTDFDGNFDAIMSQSDTQQLEFAYLIP